MTERFDLLAIGECMVEHSAGAPPEVGGDSLNTLAMAVRAGATGAYLTRVGQDELAEFVLGKIRGFGIDASQARLDPARRNGSYRILVDERGERSFVYDRKGSAASALCEEDISGLAPARVVFASGISQAISPTAALAVERAARAARESGASFAYDLNFRPALWNVDEAARALGRILPWIDTLFASEADFPVLARALGEDASPESLVRGAWRAGVGVVILKRGAEPVWAADRASGIIWQATPPRVTVRDTTAAGDSFNGAFLAARLRGESLVEALQLGTAASALTVTRPGSIQAMPDRAETEAARGSVRVQRL